MASEVAKKAAGIFVEDTLSTKMPVQLWVQAECRKGKLAPIIADFCKQRTESVDPALVIVDRVADECIHCRIPYRAADHESPSTFLTEIKFQLNPMTGSIVAL